MTTLVWETPVSGFSYADVSKVTYYAASIYDGYGHEACLMTRHRRRLDLGCFKTMEEAKRACEEHYASGVGFRRAA